MSTLKYWVWLSELVDIKPKTRSELIEVFNEPEAVFFADDKQLLERCLITDSERKKLAEKSLERANRILEKCYENGISILTIRDAAYPQRLLNIYDPPIVLYVKGRLPAVDEEAAIGIVGTRKATPYGIKMAKKLGYEITKGGGLVVTGLAAGVDSASAEGALRAGGACIGVLGCAIDEVYPSWNTMLYDDVAAEGALVSEYPPGTPIMSKNFPERNRIISGLSVGVTVIEAPLGSGALITASRALEQGREVFAVPGNADAPNCFGANNLIKEGAQLVTTGWDVLSDFELLFPHKLTEPDRKKLDMFRPEEEIIQSRENTVKPERNDVKQQETGMGFAKLRVQTDRKRIDKEKKREYIDLQEQLEGLSEIQLKIISAMDEKSKHVDDIIEISELSAPVVLSELTILQIKGFVSQESGKRFTLNIKKHK